MISPVLLLAGREFRIYVATLSFWLSLAIAPLGAIGVLLLSPHEPPPMLVTIEAGDPLMAQSTRSALDEAGHLEGRSFAFGQGGARITLLSSRPPLMDLAFASDFPLSPLGRAMVGHLIELDAARRSAGSAPLVVREKLDPGVVRDIAALSRLAAMSMLWLILTGSLGMLLQAVARERTNRSLESLLACVRPWQIVAGKILGVGSVSLLVVAGWGSTVFLLSLFAGKSGPVVGLLAEFSNPAILARYAAIYACAFAFYGATAVMFGALARDGASAQNAARPMFVLLLAGFFAALGSAGSPVGWPWLMYFPPFTPFLLLMKSPGNVAEMTQVLLLLVQLLAAVGMSCWTARHLTVAPLNHIFSWKLSRAQQLV
jgi:ABC-type Na+ efflux pump permease subunit